MPKLRSSQSLESGWSFRQTDSQNDWLEVKKVPTNVHLDLMDHKMIPDPFVDLNEMAVEWVNEKSWSYRVDLPKINRPDGATVALVFEGLDTFASVRLNGETILTSENMFTPYRVDITKHLRDENTLEMDFAPALLHAREIKAQHPDHQWLGFNGEMARLAARKAQYHWGWDWGPVLMTAGPWRPVRLETYQSRITDLRVDYKVSNDLAAVDTTVSTEVEGSADTVAVAVELDGRSTYEGTAKVENRKATVTFASKAPSLWYPHGYGKQTQYTVRATLLNSGEQVDTCSKKVGYRKVELVQNQDKIGRSFYLRINNVDTFCGGSDWIPGDSFLPSISPERYHRWLESMVHGNQIMVRVWGGGVYEDDSFYDACDELGVMVWQDFMFACGNYPAFPSFLDSVKEEVVANVRRMRHHASIVLWAGNNEDYQVQEQTGLEYDFANKDPQSWLKTNFPARYIYEKLLPDVVHDESSSAVYHPGSPWGDGKITSDPTVGDMHQWNVWHGTQEKYQIFETLGGRFNSEFGMEAFPHIQTIQSFVTKTSEMHPQSHTLDFHNKADGHERRIATYVIENFRLTNDFEGYIHLTQLMQAEALMFAYRGWRRQWGQERHCGGALVWQINDCWPGTSWAIIDYYLRKKAAYYALSRVLSPIAIGVQREHHDWSVVHARPAKSSRFSVWVVSNQTASITATVELRYVSIETGQDVKPAVVKKGISITPNGTTEILDGVVDNVADEPYVLAARIFVDGKVVSRDADWPQPYKYLSFADRGVEVRQPNHSREEDTIRVSAKRPTKGLVFEERDGVLLGDSAIDVIPGDEQTISVKGLTGATPLGYRYLGM